MRVIVTRPEREAQQWVRDLSAQGLQASALPLIRIASVDNASALVQAWHELTGYVGVMFVSANAVAHFFAAKPSSVSAFSGHSDVKTRAWATGPGTARALLREGVQPELLDTPPPDQGQFDSEALWQVMAEQVRPGCRVLIVRGIDAGRSEDASQGSGREWFARHVAQAGARPEFVVAYQRCAPEFSAAERELAGQGAADGSVWLLSSTEAVANLSAWLPGLNWTDARALATHPRIAAAARAAGFGVVCESRPTLTDVVASLESMR